MFFSGFDKDRSPEETIAKIRGILDHYHIETEVVYTADQYTGVCSNRIQLAGTSAGSNGKGIGKAYALASGYAELMERIQNDWLVNRGYRVELEEEFGFYHFPDEHLACAEEIFQADGGILTTWLRDTGISNALDMEQVIRDCSELVYARADGRIPVITFTDVTGRGKICLPPAFLKLLIGSNGMAAGNTLPEAMVQGIAELCERYVQWELFHKGVTPPQIPEEWIHYTGVWELIGQIQKDGRFRVQMYDCSLGRGLPVVGLMISDMLRGSFGFRLGAHPSMAIAMERTLTEALQGQSTEEFAASNRIGASDEVNDPYNLELMFRTGKGFCPASLLSGTPDWVFQSWGTQDDKGNEVLLERLLAVIQQEGFHVFLRDNSWMGFPAYQILIPGMCELSKGFYAGPESYRREFLSWRALDHFPELTQEEEDAILFKAEPYLKDSGYIDPDLFKRPLMGGAMAKEQIFGYLFLKREEYQNAGVMFHGCQERAIHERGRRYWKAMEEYAQWRDKGISREACIQILQKMHSPAMAERVIADTDPKDVMRKAFPGLNCFHCEECELSDKKMCSGKQEKEIFRRIARAFLDGAESSGTAGARVLPIKET